MTDCTRCKLHKTRTNIVWGEGYSTNDIMLLGEAPGRDEDKTGRPFIGRAGEVLDNILKHCNIDRKLVYITNAVKCRPPRNRRPRRAEMGACAPHLSKEFDTTRPGAVLTLGLTATKVFLPDVKTLGEVAGKSFTFPIRYGDEESSFVVYPQYHPAYVLRKASQKSKIKDQYKRAFDEILA